MADDQGYRDLGSFGSKEIKTPHLDKLASDGVRLTNFYVTWPACTPSRGSLLTGRYPQRNGTYDMYRNEAPDYGYKYKPHEYDFTWERIGGMDLREVLLPAMLKTANYNSAIFGKWDLGTFKRYLPIARGFDQFYGFVNTGIDYYTHERYGVPSMVRNNQPTTKDQGIYCTDLFKREAIRFLNEHIAANKALAENDKRGRPFFLYLPFNAPHSASSLDTAIRSAPQGDEKHRKLYPHLKIEHVERDTFGRYPKANGPFKVHTKSSKRLEYLASVSAMDTAIGEVLVLLDQHKLTHNTIVIFFSDNGGGGGSDNSPLRGGKGKMFEGGIRVPCIVRWPGVTDHVVPTTVRPLYMRNDAFLTSMEIVPTLLAAASVEPPKEIVLDGFDMRDVLAGKAKGQRTEMYWQRRGDSAARVSNWKWIKTPAGEWLFDLSKDISEKHDLAKDKPDMLAKMRQKFANWKKQMADAEHRGPFRDD